MIYVIIGPTASGKTTAANKLAEFLDCPIINGDAFQIYKDMNIGTNKIQSDDPNYKRYLLLDIVEPNIQFSVKEYQERFRALDIKQYKDVVICGGTGLYIRAALYDYDFPISEEKDEEYLDKTNEELYEMLVSLDKEASEKIHPNNRKRVIRAINLINHSGKLKSEIINSQEHKLIYDNVCFMFINPNREELYENINSRVDEMFDKGLINEVESLLSKYELSLTATQGIGYKEVISYLKGECSLLACKEMIKQRTRNYAKRQVTFFKHQFDCKEYRSYKELIKEFVK